MNNSKITTNEHGKFMTRNKDGKQFCFASAQFYKDSWSLSISTQRGCPLSCTFCDVPLFGFYGNATTEELQRQLELALNYYANTDEIRKPFYLHYARMGEPTFNPNVLDFTANTLPKLIKATPTLLTMLPNSNSNLTQFLQDWTTIKNQLYNGNAGLQFAINSTSDSQRNKMFNNASLSLQEISKLSTKLPTPLNSKYTLSFIVNKETVLDPVTLNQLFSKDKFQIKIAPVHETKSTKQNQIKTLKENDTLSVINTFKQILEEQDWEVTTLL